MNTLPDAGEIDELITNKSLRALSGSKSRCSIASDLKYNGGSLETPLAEGRPDISQGSAVTEKADLEATVSAKYNINVKNSVMAGVGLRWIAPFAKGKPEDYEGTRYDVANPYLQFQHLYNWRVQSVLQAQLMQWTQADSTARGYDKQFSLEQENQYEIGQSGVSVGASIWGQYTWFTHAGTLRTVDDANYIEDLRSVQNDYQFGFMPSLEYEITENLSLKTELNLWVFERFRNAAGSTYYQDKIFQSISLGYSVTRDIFISPNVQFLPERMVSNRTNVGLEATLNFF